MLKTRSTGECQVCGVVFEKLRPLQVVCGLKCVKKRSSNIKKELKEKVKREREDIVKRKQALKTRSDWLKEAQVAFNRFIRTRDRDEVCISSGRPLRLEALGGGYDCGHYLSTGSAPHLRFNEDNAHGQSKHDNRYLSGNAVHYRIGLIARIGLERVEALECDKTIVKWTIDDLRDIKALYDRKTKELLAKREFE